MRLFIAINFDEKTRAQICQIQDRLKVLGTVNFSHSENFHLTLAFLGETEPKKLGEICALMDGLRFPRLELSFDRVGCFSQEGSELWWLGLAQNKALLALQRELTDGLRQAGFPIESRRFSPHITLARQLRLRETPDKAQLLGAAFSTREDKISLMLSERVAGRLTYTEQYKVLAVPPRGSSRPTV